MAERDRHRYLRRRASSRRLIRPPNPSPATKVATKSIAIGLKRCSSEPTISTPTPARYSGGRDDGDRSRSFCTDILASSPSLFSNITHERYEKEAKVVVKVTVEGSPGEIRTMLKLGSTVEDTIQNVVLLFNQQRNTSKLLQLDQLELHHSYFSLQCLDKSETIGDIGSRSFYLRKSKETQKSSDSLICSEIGPILSYPSLFARTMQKIVRRTRKLWKILICSQ